MIEVKCKSTAIHSIVTDGMVYVVDNIIHREDGPAVIYRSGHTSYYCRGIQYNMELVRWAEAVLQFQEKPRDKESVQQFLKVIMQKQVEQMI